MSRKRKRIESVSSEEEYEDSDQDYSDFLDLQRCDKKTRYAFLETQREVERTEPNIMTILNTPLLLEDRAELFQLFEIYNNTVEEVSMEKLEIRKEIKIKFDRAVKKYTQYSKYTEDEHKRFDEEIKSLEGFDQNAELKYDILNLPTSKHNKRIIYEQYKRLVRMPHSDDELPKLKNWMKWAIALPYDKQRTPPFKSKKLTTFLRKVAKNMDEELYGMQKVKEQILIFLNSRITNPNMKKGSIGLIGPPGVGKTAIARLLARVADYPFEQISLGGVNKSELIKGHQYTYIGSGPGLIVKRLAKMGCKNGILFFDECDKCSDEVADSLLHVTDTTQNHEFQDTFLSQIRIDLSNLWFFYSMNKVPENDAFSDRVFMIEVPGYTQLDKFFIVKDYLLKRAHRNMQWEDDSVTLEDEAITYLVDKVSPPSNQGVRNLDRAITTIANKINFLYHHQDRRGNLPGFKTTFDMGKKIKFPLVVGREKVDIFLS
jgi:ATP-dependent Lon protease